MTTPTKRTPAKKATAPAKRAPAKRSPRAARPAPAAAQEPPELTEEDIAALVEEASEPKPGEIVPVIIGKRGRRGDAVVEMVTLFEMDDVPYQVPRNPSAALVLRWMLDLREHGQVGAAERMAVTLLGRKPLDDLAANPEVEPEDVAGIFHNLGVVFFTSDNYRKIIDAADPS